jgi:uncharacterized protein (DUF2147 family)
MKKSLLLVAALVLASFTFALAVDNGPAEINLKTAWGVSGNQKAVLFNHELHQTKNTCTDCHATEAGGKFQPAAAADIKGMNDANPAHNLCWTCHTEQGKAGNTVAAGVKKVCTKCHVGPK